PTVAFRVLGFLLFLLPSLSLLLSALQGIESIRHTQSERLFQRQGSCFSTFTSGWLVYLTGPKPTQARPNAVPSPVSRLVSPPDA
ncbi:hypothetical protein RB213_006561, partial [Colletotrichum asianum]